MPYQTIVGILLQYHFLVEFVLIGVTLWESMCCLLQGQHKYIYITI